MAIVAHDIGARVAYRFTLDHEETVARLALLDPTPPLSPYGHFLQWEAPEEVNRALLAFLGQGAG